MPKEKCPKCGSNETSFFLSYPNEDNYECSCRRCGYKWLESRQEEEKQREENEQEEKREAIEIKKSLGLKALLSFLLLISLILNEYSPIKVISQGYGTTSLEIQAWGIGILHLVVFLVICFL